MEVYIIGHTSLRTPTLDHNGLSPLGPPQRNLLEVWLLSEWSTTRCIALQGRTWNGDTHMPDSIHISQRCYTDTQYGDRQFKEIISVSDTVPIIALDQMRTAPHACSTVQPPHAPVPHHL